MSGEEDVDSVPSEHDQEAGTLQNDAVSVVSNNIAVLEEAGALQEAGNGTDDEEGETTGQGLTPNGENAIGSTESQGLGPSRLAQRHLDTSKGANNTGGSNTDGVVARTHIDEDRDEEEEMEPADTPGRPKRSRKNAVHPQGSQ